MFYPVLIITILVLAYMHVFRAFFRLRIGKSYRSRDGETTKIIAKISLGSIDVFVDDRDRRYYSNGERLDDPGPWNQTRLYEAC